MEYHKVGQELPSSNRNQVFNVKNALHQDNSNSTISRLGMFKVQHKAKSMYKDIQKLMTKMIIINIEYFMYFESQYLYYKNKTNVFDINNNIFK